MWRTIGGQCPPYGAGNVVGGAHPTGLESLLERGRSFDVDGVGASRYKGRIGYADLFANP